LRGSNSGWRKLHDPGKGKGKAKGKAKVVPVLNLASRHEGVLGSGGIVPLIL